MKLSPIPCPQLPPQFNPLLLPKSRGPSSPRGALKPDAPHPAPPPAPAAAAPPPREPAPPGAGAAPEAPGSPQDSGVLGWPSRREGGSGGGPQWGKPGVPKAGRSERGGVGGGRGSEGGRGGAQVPRHQTHVQLSDSPTCPSTAARRGGGRPDGRFFYFAGWALWASWALEAARPERALTRSTEYH